MIFSSQVAVAAFVKTPGYSPLKTRLAAGIGRTKADRFYDLAVAAVESTLLSVREQGVTAFWAVAERAVADLPRWSRLPRVPQGDGSLGKRISRVTAFLHDRHRAAIVIGADSPQMSPEELLAAAEFLTLEPQRRTHVIGKTYDGGFYLFGSNYLVDADAWRYARLGGDHAAETLLRGLDPSVPTIELPRRIDVDSAPDLRLLSGELMRVRTPSAEQRRLLGWLRSEGVVRGEAT